VIRQTSLAGVQQLEGAADSREVAPGQPLAMSMYLCAVNDQG
jgi:hypothetical protein